MKMKSISDTLIAYIKKFTNRLSSIPLGRRIDASTNSSRRSIGRKWFVAIFADVRKRPRFAERAHIDTADFASAVARFLNIGSDLSENGASNFDRKFHLR